MSNKITVIGAGSWGSALANLLAKNNNEVTLFARSNHKAITKKINITHDFKKSLEGSKFIFIVVPSTATEKVIKEIAKNKISQNVILVICSKGIENKSGKLFSKIVKESFPKNNFAILSGPNFAGEVANKSPTITTIASENKLAANKIISLLKNDYFLPIYSDDVITTQISGAIKNILAIGCGIIESLEMGENAKAALITKGAMEIILLSKKLGSKFANLLSPAGFGDLFLTCSSKKSRNFSLGVLIGGGKNPAEILSNENKVFEGASAAKSISKLANKNKIKLPVCHAINNILCKKNSSQNIRKIIQQSILC